MNDDGDRILNAVHTFIGRFVVFPTEHEHTATALWTAHAHALDCFESTPRIAFLSPEPGSGKSRALEVLETLVPRPLQSVNCSAAVMFRKVGDVLNRPTVLFDEVDTIFGPKAKEHEDIRGLLNGGHRRGASAHRMVGQGSSMRAVEFPAFAAVALAGLGDLPDTLMTRSIIVRMRRRASTEKVEPFRHRIHTPEGNELREWLTAWADQVEPMLCDVWPALPPGLVDRPADCWEPLITIADAAGGDWPERARDAALELSKIEPKDVSLGIRLLIDLASIYQDGPSFADAMHTEAILEGLNGLDDAPWGDLYGKPLDARGLSRRLRKYAVEPRDVWIAGVTKRGYRREDLWDAWGRYVPDFPTHISPSSARSARSARSEPSKQPETRSPSTPSTPSTSQPEVEGPLCDHCGQPLDPVLADFGETTHPSCEIQP